MLPFWSLSCCVPRLRVLIAALFWLSRCGQACEYLSRSNSQNRLRAFAPGCANLHSVREGDRFCARLFTRPERSAGRPGLASTDESGILGPARLAIVAPSACSAKLSDQNASTHSREARKASSLKHVRPADTGSPRGSTTRRLTALTDHSTPSTRPLHDKQSRSQAAA